MSMILNSQLQSDYLLPVNDKIRAQEWWAAMSKTMNPQPQPDYLHPMNNITRARRDGQT